MKPAARKDDARSGCFRFVVLTDTHINASETQTASPWPINRQANARARAAIAAINALAPDFAVHLGDVVQPLPGHPGYEEASENASKILGALECPLRFIPGNHDVGDKPLIWNPANPVSAHFVEKYREDYGRDWFRFEHGGCLFVGVDAQLMNAGLSLETEQWNWIEQTLQQARGKRIFFFLHYPPFIYAPDEHEHYDNLGEPARSRLLALFERFGVEACFSGHVHNFFYNLYAGTRSYTLPALSFVRHDYAGLFSVPPGDASFGRDDGAKLGFFVVDIGPAHHSVKFLRSHGLTKKEGVGQNPVPPSGISPSNEEHCQFAPAEPFYEPFGSSRPETTGFGATLRADWAHEVEIAPSGAVDEFRRKPARDDYFIAALWESGVRQLRLPIDDIVDPARRDRIRLLASDGFLINIYGFGLPDQHTMAALRNLSGAITAIETILPLPDMIASVNNIEKLGKDLDCDTVASPLVQSGTNPGEKAFIHFIGHGFSPDARIPARLLQSGISGFGFRLGHGMDPLDHATPCAAQTGAVGKTAHVHVATGGSNPAQMDRSQQAAANRALRAFISSQCGDHRPTIWLDTLTEVDRGYFPRLGLVDRRSNPCIAANVIDRLASQLSKNVRWMIKNRQKGPTGETVILAATGMEIAVHLPSS